MDKVKEEWHVPFFLLKNYENKQKTVDFLHFFKIYKFF
jgi:hypothetical protein